MKKNYVTVVIPTLNEEKTIAQCLKALQNQSFSNIDKITIVDSFSTDKTIEIAQSMGIEVIQKMSNQAEARNVGITNSSSEYIAFIDADCIPKPDWLEQLIKRMKRDSISGVGGTYQSFNNNSSMSRYVQNEISYRHSNMGLYPAHISTFGSLFRLDVLNDVGGFDPLFKNAEDNELCYRIKEHGYILAYEPSAIVYHRHPENIMQYLKEQFVKSAWRIPLYFKHVDKISGDGYTGVATHIQPLLGGLIIAGSFASFVYLQSIFIMYMAIVSVLALNTKFLLHIFKKEGIYLFLFSILVVILRTIVWALAIPYGFLIVYNRSRKNNGKW